MRREVRFKRRSSEKCVDMEHDLHDNRRRRIDTLKYLNKPEKDTINYNPIPEKEWLDYLSDFWKQESIGEHFEVNTDVM